MTDLSNASDSVPSRLGVTARADGNEVRLVLTPQPETLVHGIVRASVLSFVVDAVAGIAIDDDPDSWSLTSDMTVRMRAIPAPAHIEATSRVLRRGRRSSASAVELRTEDGALVGMGAIGFAAIPRREGDPPKPVFTPETAQQIFGRLGLLSRPLREEAGIEVLDAANGVVQVHVTPRLRNPAGTLQGAMVALLAEAAAEELAAARAGGPVVVTDLDLRYLAQAPVGPVRTRCDVLGDGPDAPIQIELYDTAAERITTLVHARTEPVRVGA